MASFTAGPGGAMIATAGPVPHVPAAQNIEGGIIHAAGAKTAESRQQAAAAFKNLGGGQKGGKRRRKLRGGSEPANVPPTNLPSAGSIGGVSHEDVLKAGVDVLNQTAASRSYDSLRNAPARLVGGRVKRRRSTKKHARNRRRTHRRRNQRSSRVSRRNRRSV